MNAVLGQLPLKVQSDHLSWAVGCGMNPWHKIRSALDSSCKTPLFLVTLGILPYVVGDVGGETRQAQCWHWVRLPRMSTHT